MNDVELAAGRETDALVEARIFGRNVERIEGVPLWVGKTLPGTPYVLKDGREAHSIKPYSTEIAPAWEVVGKLARPLKVVWTGKVWVCHVFDEPYSHEADTAPLAICRAALKVAEEVKMVGEIS